MSLSPGHCPLAPGCCGLTGSGAPDLVRWHRALRLPWGHLEPGGLLPLAGTSLPALTGLCFFHCLGPRCAWVIFAGSEGRKQHWQPLAPADAVSVPAWQGAAARASPWWIRDPSVLGRGPWHELPVQHLVGSAGTCAGCGEQPGWCLGNAAPNLPLHPEVTLQIARSALFCSSLARPCRHLAGALIRDRFN